MAGQSSEAGSLKQATLARGKIPRVQGLIADQIRQQITSGKLVPGTRLPTHRDLATEFGVSNLTVMRAMNRLEADGFVLAQANRGTFVSKFLPHLTRFALVIPGPDLPEGVHYSQFDKLSHIARQLDSTPSREVVLFDRVLFKEDAPTCQALLEDIDRQRLAGLILVSPERFPKSMREEVKHLPMVAIDHGFYHDWPFPRVKVNVPAMVEMALDEMIGYGRTRIAVIATVGMYRAAEANLTAALRQRNLNVPDHWILPLPSDAPEATVRCTRLLVDRKPADRPDAILILDDNLTEPAMQAIAESDLSVPKDILVVTHFNFPATDEPDMPVRRIGFDMRAVLQTAVHSLALQRRGHQVPTTLLIDPIFEEQVL